MATRISVLADSDEATIRVEGRLDGDMVPDLLEECRRAGDRPRIDLSGLRSVDEAGAAALRRLAEEGALLIDPSPYIRQLLSVEQKFGTVKF